MNDRVDVVVIGSGFSGSILAWILASRGLRVVVVDPIAHPRFAVGESSTPIADLLLRRLGETYSLPPLQWLSCWGSWQENLPQLACGLKRGFSYYAHQRGKLFTEDRLGERSLMVAASATEEVADTHWFRSDVDKFLYHQALASGAIDGTGYVVVGIEVDGEETSVRCRGMCDQLWKTHWLIDASGTAGVLAKLCDAKDRSDELRTNTRCQFGHFVGVDRWNIAVDLAEEQTVGDPFDGNDAAQHHLLDRGWVWMLRFNQGTTSVGHVVPNNASFDWTGYPSFDSIMGKARLIGPDQKLRSTRRMQRLFDPVMGPRHVCLPSAAVTLDPLHSAGIAHGIAGVERLAGVILEPSASRQQERLRSYSRSVLEETRLLDRLVSTAYSTMDDFERFTAACMLYFAAAIRCEEQLTLGEMPTHLWNAQDQAFLGMVDDACQSLLDRSSDRFIQELPKQIAPWNSTGLMNPAVYNRYRYTYS